MTNGRSNMAIRPFDAPVPQAETRTLDKIAQRAPEPALSYATDEDASSFLDPKVNVFDLSSDLLTYTQWQMDNSREMWKKVDSRYPSQGESFNEVRVAFNAVFDYYFQYSLFLTEYVGGQFFNRYRYGDAKGRLPFEASALRATASGISQCCKKMFLTKKPSDFHQSFSTNSRPRAGVIGALS